MRLVRYPNENYASLRDSDALWKVVGTGVGGLICFIIGAIVVMRATSGSRQAVSKGSVSDKQTRRASSKATTTCSLLGFVFGAIAVYYLFIGSAARFVDTERAEMLVVGSAVIAVGLALVSLVFGFVGIFARGRALGCVPVYFMIGALHTFLILRLTGANALEWSHVMAQIR